LSRPRSPGSGWRCQWGSRARTRRPSTRLQEVDDLVKKACRQYDKGADCFDTAAKIGIPIAGSDEERKQTEAIDCGFDAVNRGSEVLFEAEIEAEHLQPPPG
jgi:hypothetical protein